ncbi:MAG: hypothetical protein ACI9YL_000062 [Luteibaculaceae bacterium]|jgi:hypothetical protein
MRKALLLLGFMFVCLFSGAQLRWDFGVGIAAANYLGDIGGTKPIGTRTVEDLQMKQTGLGYSVFARYAVSPLTFIRAGYTYGEISGADSLSPGTPRYARNLSFRNKLHEGSIVIERAIIDNFYAMVKGGVKVDFRFYIFGGIAYYFGKPQANFNNQWYDLAPLKTEGQVTPYKTHGLSLPIGAGFNYTVFHNNNVMRYGFRLGLRKTFTDYLDDVSFNYPDPAIFDEGIGRELSDRRIGGERYSPVSRGRRGNSTYKDVYLFAELTISIVGIGGSPNDCAKFQRQLNRKRKSRKFSRANF